MHTDICDITLWFIEINFIWVEDNIKSNYCYILIIRLFIMYYIGWFDELGKCFMCPFYLSFFIHLYIFLIFFFYHIILQSSYISSSIILYAARQIVYSIFVVSFVFNSIIQYYVASFIIIFSINIIFYHINITHTHLYITRFIFCRCYHWLYIDFMNLYVYIYMTE
jgi:hypothetical protein